MDQRIFAISLGEMERLVNRHGSKLRACVISINCPGAQAPLPAESDGVLVLHFDDIEAPIEGAEDRFVLFDRAMAERILSFLQNLAGRHLIVHCHAGVARSGAVALFAHELLGTDAEQFARDNPSIAPNRLVLSMLRDLAGLSVA